MGLGETTEAVCCALHCGRENRQTVPGVKGSET